MLDFFLSYLLIYTYWVLFLVMFAASFLLPLPASTLLIATGAIVAQNYLSHPLVFIASFSGCVSGDILGYLLSWKYGRDFLARIGFRRILFSSQFARLEGLFARYSTAMILLTRFLVTGLGSSVNILSGITGVSFSRFLFFDAIGEAIYVLLFVGFGYFLGDEWQYIAPILDDILMVLAIVIVLIIAIVFKYKKTSRFQHILATLWVGE